MNLSIVFAALVIQVLQGILAQTPPDLPTIGVRVIFDGVPFPKLSQISFESLGDGQDTASILWCQSSNTSSLLTWIFPTGEVINNGNFGGLQVLSFPGTIGLFAPNGPDQIQSLGIYVCDITGIHLKVWILNVLLFPSVDLATQRCELTSTSPPAANLSVEIAGGPPSAITCQDQFNQQVNFTKSLEILQATVPVRIVIFISFVPVNSTGNITCSVENSAGAGDSILCSINRKIPRTPREGVILFLTSSGIQLPPFGQISVFTINSMEGLWCMTSNRTRGISSWILPDGTVLNSTITTSQSATVVEESGALGLFVTFGFSRLLLLGIYVCRTFDNGGQPLELPVLIDNPLQLSGPVINQTTTTCSVATTAPFSLLLQTEVTNGSPSSVECFNIANDLPLEITDVSFDNLQSILPVRILLTVIFIVPYSPGTYSCFITSSIGISSNATCTVEDANLIPPSNVAASRDPDDPTVIIMSWTNPIPVNPFLVGFEVILVAGNESVIRFVVGSSITETVRGSLSPYLNYTITVVALGNFNNGTVALPSRASIPAFVPSLKANCLPAHGQRVMLTLKRKRQPFIDNGSGPCSEVDQLFLLLAINSSLVNSNAVSKECSIARSKSFNCQDGGMKPGDKKDDVEVQIIVIIFCNPCDVIDGERPMMKKPPKKILENKKVPKNVVVKGKRYDINSKDEGKEGVLCGNELVENEDTCDCPDECIL